MKPKIAPGHAIQKNNLQRLKIFFGMLACVCLLNSCDDGDVSVDTIDFSEIEADDCGNIIYKISANEALFFELNQPGAFATAFQNEPTPEGTPRVFIIDNANRVFYRAYDNTVTSGNFCTPIPPISPVVTEQWTASSGTIEITTAVVKVPNTNVNLAGGEKIARFRHTINFRNITFQKPDGEQFYETYAFGYYDTYPNASLFAFGFNDTVEKCASSDDLYNYFGREGLILHISPSLIANEVTPLGDPREAYLGAENTLTYKFFNDDGNVLTTANFCGTLADLPVVLETWIGVDGVPSEMTGLIEVTTTTNGPGSFLHEIRLKKVTLRKGASQFLLADDYLFGQLVTTE